MKREKQVEESKNLIKQALLELLESNEYTDITLSMIANKANVSRMTLYRHFKDKEDIVLFSFHQNMEKFLNDAKHEMVSVKDILRVQLEQLQQSREIQILFENDQLQKIINATRDETFINFSHAFKATRNIEIDPYSEIFIFGGIMEVIKVWYSKGMVESIECICDKIVSLIMKTFN